MLLNWIIYKIRRKRKLTFVLPWNMMLPFQKCSDICGRMQYGDRCYHCHCYLGVCSINIFFVPLVQKNHFDVVFNANVWACYIQYWCFLKIFISRAYLSYFPPSSIVSCVQFDCGHYTYCKCKCINQRALSCRFLFHTVAQW